MWRVTEDLGGSRYGIRKIKDQKLRERRKKTIRMLGRRENKNL